MSAKTNTFKVDGRVLQLSNLDKVLYPAAEFTKAEVIDYYIKISPYVLPHLKDRPLTLKRFPDGIEGPHFYEKNAPKYTPEWVKLAPVWRKSKESKIKYILMNDLPTLVWSANLANLELHTMLARAPKIEVPTMIVFDLDPGPPANVIDSAQVAIWIREILNRFELESYPKFSGSKGIQLYIPLNTLVTYDQTSEFARALARLLEKQHPKAVVSEMAKSERVGKVFIDWSQNSEHKTTVCVYSLRAKREKPYVAMPFTWAELEKALKKGDPTFFDFLPEDVLNRVEKKGDLFQPVLEMQQSFPRDYEEKLQKMPAAAAPKRTAPARKGKDTSIREYRAKRDFSKTAEPPPRVESKKTSDLMFVIQKHIASRLHYDFRLEMEGVLRSWAVPKGPPTSRADKRLAMHVEDHPMDYARFEGIIPEGNYGAGTVMVWDIGTYSVKDGHPVRAYYTGKIPLILNGKKLKGEWVLVKSPDRNGDNRRWLLMKTGSDFPSIGPKKDDQSVLTGRTMKQIAAAKDAEWISNRKKASKVSRRWHR